MLNFEKITSIIQSVIDMKKKTKELLITVNEMKFYL